MKRYFVDTNLFLRYLTNDDSQKADRVEKLLHQAASGKIKLLTAEMVMAEVVWVLESYYQLSPEGIAPMIRAILATPGLEVTNAPLVERALSYYELGKVDFVDGYIAAVMQKHGVTDIYSFDRKYMSLFKELKRIEP